MESKLEEQEAATPTQEAAARSVFSPQLCPVCESVLTCSYIGGTCATKCEHVIHNASLCEEVNLLRVELGMGRKYMVYYPQKGGK